MKKARLIQPTRLINKTITHIHQILHKQTFRALTPIAPFKFDLYKQKTRLSTLTLHRAIDKQNLL